MDATHVKKFLFNYDRKIALAFGCFDILHIGHVRFLREVKRRTDLPLCIGILPDFVVSSIKGQDRPVVCEDQRLEVISELRSVDFAFKLEQLDHITVLKEEFDLDESEIPLWSTALCWLDILRPQEFFYSSDFVMTPKIKQFFLSRNINAIMIQYTNGISTSEILKRFN
ncbi:MAG: adenylyltransferase/cytidyltransferase family protein [Christensenellales bacterium]